MLQIKNFASPGLTPFLGGNIVVVRHCCRSNPLVRGSIINEGTKRSGLVLYPLYIYMPRLPRPTSEAGARSGLTWRFRCRLLYQSERCYFAPAPHEIMSLTTGSKLETEKTAFKDSKHKIKQNQSKLYKRELWPTIWCVTLKGFPTMWLIFSDQKNKFVTRSTRGIARYYVLPPLQKSFWNTLKHF